MQRDDSPPAERQGTACEPNDKLEDFHDIKLDCDSPVTATESRESYAPKPQAQTQTEAQQSHSAPEQSRFKEDRVSERQSKEETPNLHDISVDDVGNEEARPTQAKKGHQKQASQGQEVSEWSHQHLVAKPVDADSGAESEWQVMPSFASYDMYNDDNKLIAREAPDDETQLVSYAGAGGAGNGYTKINLDEDAQSATSLDDDTRYLFKESNQGTEAAHMEDDEEQRDAISQMQATKDLLTEGQRIAYTGIVRLVSLQMIQTVEVYKRSKATKKVLNVAAESLQRWSQQIMIRLYTHMEITSAEQIMIEQLAEHSVQPADLTPLLMINARVKNPMNESSQHASSKTKSPSVHSTGSGALSRHDSSGSSSHSDEAPRQDPAKPCAEQEMSDLPSYEEHKNEGISQVKAPSQMTTEANLDIDIRWTVLCDLFLILIAGSVYDARSRVLLEHVGKALEIPWIDICRFEKRVTDALELQQQAEKENWNEDEHKENRRKLFLKKRYMTMGLVTVGGSLVIGLSAGLMAPLIGAGLAAGFTTIGITGTSGFLAGGAAATMITVGATASGGLIAAKAADRRTGAVSTFEYRPLYNNKRLNLIVTVAGWMQGDSDDVRLPFSTVDPLMGDIYSVLWEPDMLKSTGDTMNILATEAFTQGLQHVLGATILTGLMAALQLPIVLSKLSYLIDNPWNVSLDRAHIAGLILADSLLDRNLGTRPITLVGYSLGSKMIFSCLQELAKKGAYGLIQNVYLFGSPIVVNQDEYLMVRTVIAGRFVNGYSTNDWILGYLFRLTSGGIRRVAGLAAVENVPGLENIDVTELVAGHMAYRSAMPRLMRRIGYMVQSDHFTEIEQPDPNSHTTRQRTLVNEAVEARKREAAEKLKKPRRGFSGLFGRFGKQEQEKPATMEPYSELDSVSGKDEKATSGSSSNSSKPAYIFDIEAIRAEITNQEIEVRELESTLPPLELDLKGPILTSPASALWTPVERITAEKDSTWTERTITTQISSFTPATFPAPQSKDFDHDSLDFPPSDPDLDHFAYHHNDEGIQMIFDTSLPPSYPHSNSAAAAD